MLLCSQVYVHIFVYSVVFLHARQRSAAKKRGAIRSDNLSTKTKVASENKPCGNHCPPHVFLGAVRACFFHFFMFQVKQFIIPLCFAGSLLLTAINSLSGNNSFDFSIALLSVSFPKIGKTK